MSISKQPPSGLLVNDAAYNALAESLGGYEEGRSSHWRHEQNSFEFDGESFYGVGQIITFSQSQNIIAT